MSCTPVGTGAALTIWRWISEKWSGFHEAAENSTGVGKGLKKEHCADPRDDSAAGQPQEVRDAIQANLADYEHLRQFVRRA